MEKKAGAGRPKQPKVLKRIVFEPRFCVGASKLCALGATDLELADFFGIDVRTLHRWKFEFPDFCHSIKAAKATADERVERPNAARPQHHPNINADGITARRAQGLGRGFVSGQGYHGTLAPLLRERIILGSGRDVALLLRLRKDG